MNILDPKTQEAMAKELSKMVRDILQKSQFAEQLQQMKDDFKPVLDFARDSEVMTADDVNLIWDIKLIRGRGHTEPFIHLRGSSSSPSMLACNMRCGATLMIQHEVTEKIMRPLIAKLQEVVDKDRLAEPPPKKRVAEAYYAANDEEDEDEKEYPC